MWRMWRIVEDVEDVEDVKDVEFRAGETVNLSPLKCRVRLCQS